MAALSFKKQAETTDVVAHPPASPESMMMKKLLAISALLFTQFAHADWTPVIDTYTTTSTISYNGGSVAFTESRGAGQPGGPLANIAGKFLSVPYQVQSGLNTFLSQQAAANGTTFLGGTVSGDMDITIQPSSAGYMLMNLKGISYTARTKFSGRKLGVITFECVNTMTLANINATAQYGASNGALSGQTGLTANVSSSTDCDSNLSWMLPVVGNYIISKIEGKIDANVAAGINAGISQVKDTLFFAKDQDFLAGLNRLVPADKVVTLPNGSTFAIGQYVRNNLAYLNTAQVNIKLGKGAPVAGVYGLNEPRFYSFSGDVLNLTITTPSVSFGVRLSETDYVSWNWRCSLRDPSKRCEMP